MDSSYKTFLIGRRSHLRSEGQCTWRSRQGTWQITTADIISATPPKFEQIFPGPATKDDGLNLFLAALYKREPAFKTIRHMANALKHLYTRATCTVASGGAVYHPTSRPEMIRATSSSKLRMDRRPCSRSPFGAQWTCGMRYSTGKTTIPGRASLLIESPGRAQPLPSRHTDQPTHRISRLTGVTIT
jgi:hypothetical protein